MFASGKIQLDFVTEVIMIPVTKLRNGTTFEENGDPWKVIQYTHTHLSRGAGTIKVKCRNLRSGQVLNKTYKGNDKVEEIDVNHRPMQYLYREGDSFVFMEPQTFEQVMIDAVVLGDEVAYLKEGETVHVLFWGDDPLTLDLPPKMVFAVKDAAPGEKGDSASNVYKDAVLENGLKIRVPLFINPGDKVRVDTRDGSYIERA
jgi:elongation factor P